MKLLYILALIISVAGYDIPAEGMDTTVTEAQCDVLSGKMQMSLDGSLISTAPLTVTITRSAANLEDEFCCAGQCTTGNGETSQTLEFAPNGKASWYLHYYPQPDSDEQVTYTFSDGSESYQLRVRYAYKTQDIETITDHQSPITVKKVLRDGIIYIISNDRIYHL